MIQIDAVTDDGSTLRVDRWGRARAPPMTELEVPRDDWLGSP